MRTLSKMVFSALLLALLLTWAGTCRARSENPFNNPRTVRHEARIRFRRTSRQHPARYPFTPQSQVAIPPDEDDDDHSRVRNTPPAACEGTRLPPLSTVCPHSDPSHSRPRRILTEPLYQTLGVLLL